MKHAILIAVATLAISGAAQAQKSTADGIAEVTGSTVSYVNQTEAEYAAQLASHGLPEAVAQMLAGWDTAIAGGALHSTSTDLADLIGRPTTSLVDTLRAL